MRYVPLFSTLSTDFLMLELSSQRRYIARGHQSHLQRRQLGGPCLEPFGDCIIVVVDIILLAEYCEVVELVHNY